MKTCCTVFHLSRSHLLTSWFWHNMKRSAFSLIFIMSMRSCCRILDVWDICRPALIALDFDVKIGDVQPSCGKWTDSQIECVVNEDLFPSKDSYQIHINSDRVCRGYYSYDRHFTYCKTRPSLCTRAKFMTFNRIQSRAVIGLLTGHNTLQRYLYLL